MFRFSIRKNPNTIIRLLSMIGVLFFVNIGWGEELLDAKLNERVLMLPGAPTPPVDLQVTIFTPDGTGPFPIAVLNHGKNRGDPRDHERWRAPYATRYFLSRGYAVVLPMGRGFAGSGGTFSGMNCDVERDALSKAEDIRSVISQLSRDPALDTTRIVVLGQSYGGLNTLALGSLKIPGVKVLVNFSGGRRQPLCANYKSDLVKAVGHFAERTTESSIWFYGENDLTFPPDVWRPMFDAYRSRGGKAELVDYGVFGKDAHEYLASPQALQLWSSPLDDFLAAHGLPSTVVHPDLLPYSYPLPTGFARINDVDAIPYLNDAGRRDYFKFLDKQLPRVAVISRDGAAYYASGGYDPLARALVNCRKQHETCLPYAVDEDVVWSTP